MKRTIFVWSIVLASLGNPLLHGQESGTTSSSLPKVSKAEWNRLKGVASDLISEDRTHKLYLETPSLADSFASESFFLDLVAKWRPKISALPDNWSDSSTVDVEVSHREDGTATYFVTYHHEKPTNSITILKTIWRDETLLKVAFIKGFANVPFDNADKIRALNQQEDYERRWRSQYQQTYPPKSKY